MLSEIEALVVLNNIQGLGPKSIIQLIKRFGSAQAILKEPEFQIEESCPGKGFLIAQWERKNSWVNDLKLIEKEDAALISFEDPRYPKELFNLSNYPPLLYLKGNILCLNLEKIAIIGTRNATCYGKEMALLCAKEAGRHGVCVVSGLARGIDTSAHEGALMQGQTISVIGSGLSNLYPKENSCLAEKIAKRGALISEYPMYTAPARHTFPQRNRIVAALAKALILIESPLDGGAMITMEIGEKLKKELYAFPGRADCDSFKGNHALIKKGKATLIEGFKDLPFIDEYKEEKRENFVFSPEESRFLSILGNEEKNIEELVLLTQLPVMKLNILLTSLLLKQAVRELPGKVYKKNFN